jgi:hypothetical protein
MPGDEYDVLQVSGQAKLGGVVLLKGLNGFTPQVGSNFDVVSATRLVDDGFAFAMYDSGLAQPKLVDLGGGTTGLRIESIAGNRYAPQSGSWDTASNWSDGSPTLDDTAFLPGQPSTNTTVAGPSADSSVASLVVGSGGNSTASTTTLVVSSGIISTARGTTIRRGGRLTGNGEVGGFVYNAGSVVPGEAIGVLNVDGNFMQDEAGTLEIELAGIAAGSQYDQLRVNGTATFGGTLALAVGSSLTPAAGDKFTIITASNRINGAFASTTGNTSAGVTLWPAYIDKEVLLVATVAGEKTWGVDADGLASTGSNWLGGVAPDGAGERATFGNIIGSNRSVDIDQPLTVGTLKFDDDNNYTLQGAAELILQSDNTEPARLQVLNAHGNGAHTISAPVVIASDVVIDQQSAGSLTITGPIRNSAGRAIRKTEGAT